jgi:DedD protein
VEAPLQQRIVGAIVLVTLGVIFIPALLDGSGYRSRQVQDIEIKEKPEFPPLTQKKVTPIPTPLEANRQEQVQVQKTDPEQVHKKPVKSFALQVGTFGSNENAEKMRDEMIKAGYNAFVHKSTSKGKTSYKVRVGPELERSVLEKIKSDLKKSKKIDAYVVNHP